MKDRFTYTILIVGLLMATAKSESWAARQDSLDRSFIFDQVDFSYRSGMIMPHVPAIDFMVRDYTSGMDLRLLHTTDGAKNWHQHFHHPRLGLGYYWGSLGNDQVYGRARSLYGFFEAPALTLTTRTAFHYRMSAGLSYISQKFDKAKNLYNIAIGSHLNLHYKISLLASFRFMDDYQLIAGIGLNHFSNGKIRSPNKGLNLISGSVGLRHSFWEPDKQKKASSPPDTGY